MSQPEPPPGKFVFLDVGGKRWPRAKRLVVLLGALAFVLAVAFVQSLLVAPQLVLPLKVKKLKEQLKSLQRQAVAPTAAVANAEAIKAFYRSANGKRRLDAINAQLAPHVPRVAKPPGQIRLGFFVGWDPNSMDSLTTHADKLTHVCPEWFTLTSAAGDLAGENNVALLEFLAANKQLTLLPLLTNLAGDARNAEAVENLAHGPADVQSRFVENLKQRLLDIKAGGVLIDWAGLDPAYQADFTRLLNVIADGLHSAHLELWLQIPVGEERQAFDIDALSDPVDYFVAALHDQNSEEDAPGPIAAQNWFAGWLDAIKSYGDPDQWVIALGAYGYDWAESSAPGSKTGYQRADTVSFADAMSRAAYAGEGNTESGKPEYNPSFDYTLAGVNHELWFLDAITFLNQARAARAKGFTGFAIARLGTEEGQLWPALDLINAPKLSAADLASLRELRTKSVITNIGEGEIVSVDISPADGHRQLSLDEPGESLISATYEKFPRYPSLYHQGAGGEHEVAITFDDGPDPTWTPKVLDVLREKGVKAAFFLVGQQAENYPDLVRQLVSEGHTIGSHTYTHTNLALCSEQRVKLELDATERLIESITGRSTTLFRPPYNADSRPSQLSEIVPLAIAQDLNYLTVLESIDPEDWARPGADVILQRIKQQRKSGNIILLHDAGGDRSQTVEALPKIIDYLRARGDVIVPLAQLIGADRDAVNPPVRAGVQGWARLASSVGFQTLHTVFGFVWAFMIVATGLIVLRTLIIVALALRQRRRGTGPVAAPTEPLSVIIAAYNEEKVIAATLRSVLETDYAGPVEVIVIDDGSRDETSAIALAIAEGDRRVHVVTQANTGKSEALRRGVNISHHGTLVFLDADTHFQPDTLRRLVEPFADERVGAVSGHARVGNPRSFIARCQALEYICGFNLDRRAYDAWDCITVAPGAVSAIRASALREAGGFLPDTLAEDTDLTLTLHRRGYLIRYSAAAVAWTEAPETIGALAKQRFRWCFGTMQCLWKHRDMLFNPKFGALGFFSLPSVWFFQIILVALTPMVDLLLLASVLLGDGRAVLPYFVTFLLLDQVLAIMACLLEGEPVARSWIMIPMRLIYRPLLSWVVWRSILNAARGVLVGWGKLERTASVMVPAGAGGKK